MQLTQLLSPAIRSLLPAFVAETVMRANLPPLTRTEDQDFLRGVMESVIDAFWEAYVEQLGPLAQKKLAEAAADETGEKIWAWLQENADFKKNEGARLLAQEIMADFKRKLPDILKQAYAQFPTQAA